MTAIYSGLNGKHIMNESSALNNDWSVDPAKYHDTLICLWPMTPVAPFTNMV